MSDTASRDQNFVPTLMGVSNVDGVSPVTIYADPVTHRLLTSPTGSGAGDVVGPASATDNAIARFDSTTGKLLQNSVVTISDTGAITVAGAFTLPIVDGTNGQVLTTNGAGVVSWQTGSGTVTTVSVVSANGFAGSVANATTTPAITLSTTITGLLKGNGTAISAAVAGTDYEVPLTFSTGLTRTINTVTVNTSQNIATLSNLTSNGLVTTSGGVGTLGITVPGTGVLTALGINVGSAGAFVTFNGALGTPSSGTVTNLTGTASININGTVGATTPTTATFTVATINTGIIPDANDGAYLGTSTAQWSDLFLAEGAVINWDNGDATLTQTGNAIAWAGITSYDLGTSTALTTGTIELGAASDTTISRSAAGVIAVEGVVIPSISSTNTLTNKRITPRVTSITSNVATPTINTDNCDIVVLTGQTNNITSMTTNLSGTPTDGQMLRIAMTASSGTPTVTWGASFEDSTVTAPTALSTTRVDVGFVWNATTSKWRCVAKA